eukprot:gene5765-6201_t
MIDLIESDGTLDMLMNEVIDVKDLSETCIDSLIEGISRQYLAVPDTVFQFSNVQVYQRLNTPGSKIIATTMVRGTMLYSVVPTQKYTADNSNKQLSYEIEDSGFNNHVILELLDKRIEYCMKGIVTISLDDQHRILSICIEAERFEL